MIGVPAHVFPAIRLMAIATFAGAFAGAIDERKAGCLVTEKNPAIQLTNSPAG